MERKDSDNLISLLDKYGLEALVAKLYDICYQRGKEALKVEEWYNFAFWRTSTDIMKNALGEIQLLEKMFSTGEQGSNPENK